VASVSGTSRAFRVAASGLIRSVFLLCVVLAGTANAQPDVVYPPPVFVEKPLRPGPPRGRFREIHFSPNGQMVFARDDSSITVLSVKPLRVLFRVRASQAQFARFTPDSRELVFVSSPDDVARAIGFAASVFHLERWTIATQTRTEFRDLDLRPCHTAELSPDGRILACIGANAFLRLTNIPTGRVVYSNPRFAKTMWNFGPPGYEFPATPVEDVADAVCDFSPDGRYFFTWSKASFSPALAWDINEARQVRIAGDLKHFSDLQQFLFVAPDRILIARKILGPWTWKWTYDIASFPAGQKMKVVTSPPGVYSRAADPAFIITLPYDQSVAIAIDLSTGSGIVSRNSAIDIFGDEYVAETAAGQIGLHRRGKGLQQSISIE
jgi:WD40 repeat protein